MHLLYYYLFFVVMTNTLESVIIVTSRKVMRKADQKFIIVEKNAGLEFHNGIHNP